MAVSAWRLWKFDQWLMQRCQLVHECFDGRRETSLCLEAIPLTDDLGCWYLAAAEEFVNTYRLSSMNGVEKSRLL
jgi:hypothetical protein